jgi:hypothetical protein
MEKRGTSSRAIAQANSEHGFIQLFPLSGKAWTEYNAHGLKVSVQDRVLYVHTRNDKIESGCAIPYASPDGVRGTIEMAGIPYGDNYPEAAKALQEAVGRHVMGTKETGGNQQDGGKIELVFGRAADLNLETGSQKVAYAEEKEVEDCEEEIGTLTPVEILEQYRYEVGVWAGLNVTGNITWKDDIRFFEDSKVSAGALADTMDFNTPWLRLVFKFPFMPIKKSEMIVAAAKALGYKGSELGIGLNLEELFAEVLRQSITLALQGSAPSGLDGALRPLRDKAARPGTARLANVVEILSGCWDAIFTPEGVLQHLRSTLLEDIDTGLTRSLRKRRQPSLSKGKRME